MKNLSDLSCDCDNQSLEMKLSIGHFNDHFHFVRCKGCEKRTWGRWTEEEAVNDWIANEFFIA